MQVCEYSRLISAININGSVFFYWVLIIFGILYLLTMIGLLIFMNFFLKNRRYYSENTVVLLRYMVLLLYWVFFLPFYEAFISILRCHDGHHYLDTSIACYQGLHIVLIAICIVFLFLLVSISLVIALFYNETQPIQEDCLSRLETSLETALVIFRTVIGTFTPFCESDLCSWILIAVYIVSSAMLCY